MGASPVQRAPLPAAARRLRVIAIHRGVITALLSARCGGAFPEAREVLHARGKRVIPGRCVCRGVVVREPERTGGYLLRSPFTWTSQHPSPFSSSASKSAERARRRWGWQVSTSSPGSTSKSVLILTGRPWRRARLV
jgi:hypothetical protein